MDTPDDAIRLRHPTEDELPAVYRNQARTFGDPMTSADVEAWIRRVEVENMLVAEDVSDPERPFLVGTSIIYPSRLTVPGGGTLRAAWLTMIAVASSHVRTGIWAQLSARGLEILLDRGYPVICGVPTQTAIYDGFGAGVATYANTYCIDRRFAKLRAATGPNRAREVDADAARGDLPEIYERWAAATAGAMDRNSAWWADYFEDRSTQRGSRSALNYTIHPDCFLTYRVTDHPPHDFRPPFGTILVQDFCAITDEAHTDLLQTLFAMQMFDEVRIEVPVDDALPLKVGDQRAARTCAVSDFLWVRINDVPEVLGTREYSADIEVVLEVTDPLGLGGGRFMLHTRSGVGKCTPHDGEPQVEIGLGELGSLFMGAHRASDLHRANRITERQRGALRELDAAFGVERAPYCGTLF
jgi:predicted acetyltransferase